MKFMLILKSTKDSEAGKMPSEATINAMVKYNQDQAKAGVLVDAAGLWPSSKGARLKISADGKKTVTDGPFTESKELVAGYWIINVKSLAEAIEWAKRAPGNRRAGNGNRSPRIYRVRIIRTAHLKLHQVGVAAAPTLHSRGSNAKLIYAINLTLDGCCDHRKGTADEKILEHYTQQLGGMDALAYGRKTYELMFPYWPEVLNDPTSSRPELDYAKVFTAKKRVVFSRTLTNAEPGTQIISSHLREEVLKLKQEPGGDILLGGVDVASQLIALGLVDEFRIVILPIIAGEGRRLLDTTTLAEKMKLKLIDTKTFGAGFVALRYAK